MDIYDLHKHIISETDADLTKGRLVPEIKPKKGVHMPEGMTKYDLPPKSIEDILLYVPYTDVELRIMSEQQHKMDIDSLLIDQEYRLTLLELGV